VGYLDDLSGTIVGLDTSPIIYFIEKNLLFHSLIRPFFNALANGEFTAVTSTVTLLETLVHPIRTNHIEIARQYREILLNSSHIITLDVSPDIAQKAAEIRALYSLRTPDAIQLATASYMGASYFLTNDRGLMKFTEINVLVIDDLT
jgi:predicted nucleic acid-binding protein